MIRNLIKLETLKAKLIVAGILLIVFVVTFWLAYRYRVNQQIQQTQESINQGREAISNSQVDEWAANQNAKDREAEVKQAEQRSKKAKEAAKIKPKENVKFEEANRNRCEAFPDSKECRR